MPRLKYKVGDFANLIYKDHQAAIKKSIKRITSDIKDQYGLTPYDLKGLQQAKTTVNTMVKKTANMHSEMEAIEYLLNNDSGLLAGWLSPEPTIFSTDVEHCYHCALHLHTLGLPLSKPTNGLSKKACHYSYVLPTRMKYDISYISRFLCGGYHDYSLLSKMFMSCFDSKVIFRYLCFCYTEDSYGIFSFPATLDQLDYMVDYEAFVISWSLLSKSPKLKLIVDAMWTAINMCIYDLGATTKDKCTVAPKKLFLSGPL